MKLPLWTQTARAVGNLTARARARSLALATVLGGLLIAGGSFLPWLTFYAGLYPMRGVMGLWGRLMAVGGGLCVVAGVGAWRRSGEAFERWIAALGVALMGFAGWLVLQLLLTFRHLVADPMVVPRLGPGLFVAFAGTLLVGAPAFRRLRGRSRLMTGLNSEAID